MENFKPYESKRTEKFYLDPRTKILFMIFITTFMSFIHSDLTIVALIAFITILLLFTNKQYKTALIYGGLFILALLSHYTKDMYAFPVIHTFLVLLNTLILRFFPVFMLGYYLIKSTKTNEFISSMTRWKVSNALIIPIAVVFRFVPSLSEENNSIKNAMKMRGISFANKKFWKNPSLYLEYVSVPLIISIAKIGEELSAAALTRGLGRLEKRTSITKIKFTKHDFLMLFVSLVLISIYLYRRLKFD